MSTVRQILRNTATGWVAVVIRAVIALVMVPFLFRYLGKEGYGLIGLLGVIVGISSVADLGLRGALGRELSEQVARKDSHAFNELASTALALYLCIAGVLAVTVWLLTPWMVNVFKVSEAMRSDAIWLIRIYGSVSVVLSFITPVFSAALSSYHRFDIINSIQIVGGILSSLMLFAVLSVVSNPLYGWVGVMLLFQLVVLVLTIRVYRRYCEGAKVGIQFWNAGRLIPLFKLGGSMYALQMTNALAERSDPLVISYFFGPSGVALYQPGARLSQMIRPVVLTLSNQMHPLATKQHIDNSKEKMEKILILGTKYTLLPGALFSAVMFVFAEPFCRLWLERSIGEDYLVAAQVMMGWALADFMTYAAGTQWPILLGKKKLKFLIWTQIPTAILNILISIYLVGFTSLGIPGVLVATIIIGFVRRPILIWYTAKVCSVRPVDYFKNAYLTPLVCFVMTCIGAYALKWIVLSDTLLTLVLCAGGTSVVWAITCYFIGLTSTEREQVVCGFKQLLLGGTKA